jgi:NAD(P)-dependent dehydrogenase (short-subunit alcohol dehydrogenase family)
MSSDSEISTGNRIALVTGGGSGIGRATAIALARAGYAIAVAGRRADALEGTLAATGGGLAVPADVSDEASVVALFQKVKERFGRLDLLFNNAGTAPPPLPFEELTAALWSKVVAVNLTGSFLCAREAFRMMKEQSPQGGRIINTGSISAHAPRPLSAPYTATKHAITGLTKSLSLDGRPYHIACGQIDIGNAETELAARMRAGVMQANGMIAPEPTMPLQHVADAVLFMASLPLEANVQFITVMATRMPFVGRG